MKRSTVSTTTTQYESLHSCGRSALNGFGLFVELMLNAPVKQSHGQWQCSLCPSDAVTNGALTGCHNMPASSLRFEAGFIADRSISDSDYLNRLNSNIVVALEEGKEPRPYNRSGERSYLAAIPT